MESTDFPDHSTRDAWVMEKHGNRIALCLHLVEGTSYTELRVTDQQGRAFPLDVFTDTEEAWAARAAFAHTYTQHGWRAI